MSSCGDEDFAILADGSPPPPFPPPQSQHPTPLHHHQTSVPFITHRYVSQSSSSSNPNTTTLSSLSLHLKKNLVAGLGQQLQEEDGYAAAFSHHHISSRAEEQEHEQEKKSKIVRSPPHLPNTSTAFHHNDVACCLADTTATSTFGHSSPPLQPHMEEIEDHVTTEAPRNRNHHNYNCQTVMGISVDNSNVNKRDRDDLSDDGASPLCFSTAASIGGAVGNKRTRHSSTSLTTSATGNAAAPSSGDYRKDREEWSDTAIGCLLDAYTDKYIQLNRGNLRGRDWEEVATTVSERCDKHKSCKSVEQCKNKVDNLKKRYKAERQRLNSGSLSTSHWPWFNKLEQIVGSSASTSITKPISDDDRFTSSAPAALASAGGGSFSKQAKRHMTSTANAIKVKSSTSKWKRVVLKLSGMAFAGNGAQNVEPEVTMMLAREISMAIRLGVQVAIVVGGRNFFCGDAWVASTGIDRTTAYQIGMMATVMNSILLQASLEKVGVQARVQTSFTMQEVAEPYIRRRAIRHLEKGRVVIFAGVGAGSENSFFNTDTAFTLRASEINADAVLKGICIKNVYNCHSRGNSIIPFEHISYRESFSRGFSDIDATAITFCEENNISVVVFNILEPGNISRALCGEQVGTLIDRYDAVS